MHDDVKKRLLARYAARKPVSPVDAKRARELIAAQRYVIPNRDGQTGKPRPVKPYTDWVEPNRYTHPIPNVSGRPFVHPLGRASNSRWRTRRD